MKFIPGMCCAKLDIYVFIDFPVFIPWTHQMMVYLNVFENNLNILGSELKKALSKKTKIDQGYIFLGILILV
jgi:hypothetical protein